MSEQTITIAEVAALMTSMSKPSKYRNRKTFVPELNRSFSSQREADAAVTLWRRQRAGEIRALEFQPRFPIEIDGVLICTYVADFQWEVWNPDPTMRCWDRVVADSKGYRTDVFKIKSRLMSAVLGIDVKEL